MWAARRKTPRPAASPRRRASAPARRRTRRESPESATSAAGGVWSWLEFYIAAICRDSSECRRAACTTARAVKTAIKLFRRGRHGICISVMLETDRYSSRHSTAPNGDTAMIAEKPPLVTHIEQLEAALAAHWEQDEQAWVDGLREALRGVEHALGRHP